MKNYVRPNYSLDDYESLPQRESMKSNIKQYQDYWSYWERNSTRVDEAYAYLHRLSDKYQGKPAKDFINKVKSCIKYKKCFLFRDVAQSFIESAINKPDPTFSSYGLYLINIDNILYYSWNLDNSKPRIKTYNVYFQFIKYLKQSTDALATVDSAYFIYKDKYYIGEINYKSLRYDKSIKLLDSIKSPLNFKNIKEVHPDLKLDLEDYLNGY